MEFHGSTVSASELNLIAFLTFAEPVACDQVRKLGEIGQLFFVTLTSLCLFFRLQVPPEAKQ